MGVLTLRFLKRWQHRTCGRSRKGMSGLTPSGAGPRQRDGGRSSGAIREITWHRWRYRRAARRRQSGGPLPNRRKFLMTPHRLKVSASALALALTSVAVAACGGSTSTGSTRTAAAAASPSQDTVNVVSTGQSQILVDSTGRTLYLFEADSGTASNCSDACAAAWPPLLTNGKPTTGASARASLIATTKRSDGTSQVTYNGHPLYRFASDTMPGDTTGQAVSGFGALWYVLSAAGNPITNLEASSGAGSPTNANPY
jgi:predicted lipoprotein with Yx(FWY)xxD motif